MKITILYEDKDILVINKPSGLAVHRDGKSKESTVADWFLEKYPKAKNVGEPIVFEGSEIKKPGIVHRLDRDTSGVLILVKNQKTHEFLKKQFQDHSIKKTYVAIVNGWPKADHGIIDKPIGRSPSDFRRRLAGRGARGELREAVTEYKVLKRFKAKAGKRSDLKNLERSDLKEAFSILEVFLKTGRTHQIRVHLKYLSFPIVCDILYNPTGVCPEGLNRMGLHAKSIEFKNLKGEMVKVESPLPKEFSKMLKYKDETRD